MSYLILNINLSFMTSYFFCVIFMSQMEVKHLHLLFSPLSLLVWVINIHLTKMLLRQKGSTASLSGGTPNKGSVETYKREISFQRGSSLKFIF